jgi:hypothetical protein
LNGWMPEDDKAEDLPQRHGGHREKQCSQDTETIDTFPAWIDRVFVRCSFLFLGFFLCVFCACVVKLFPGGASERPRQTPAV